MTDKDGAEVSPVADHGPKPPIGRWIGIGIGAGIGSAAVAAALLYTNSIRSRTANDRPGESGVGSNRADAA